MTRSIAAILLAASVSLMAPSTTEAQLGGLIKKKVKEAIKKPEKPAEPAPGDPASPKQVENSPSSRGGASHGLPTLNGRWLLITPETLARLQRGLDSELSMIADFEKVLATYPTPEQYQQCKDRAAQSPDGKKAAAPMMNLPDNVSPEKLQQIIMKMNEDMMAVMKKACPKDPNDWNDSRRRERLMQIHQKAASMAVGTPKKSAGIMHERGQQALLFDVSPFELLADTTDTVTVLGTDGLSEQEYNELGERVFKYCELYKTMDMSPKGRDFKVAGEGQDIYWIFADEELQAMKSMSCEAFAKKYAKLFARRLY